MMGIDKIRLISMEPPGESFLAELNADLHLRSIERDSKRYEIRLRDPCKTEIDCWTEAIVYTRKHLEPAFYLSLNFRAFPGHGSRWILETNPNKLARGHRDFDSLIRRVFGPFCPDLKVSRIDLNADIGLPVDFFSRSLRIPYKRKSSTFGKKAASRVFSDRGITGFQIGASPSLLRIYDKREEMKKARQDLAGVPRTLTRVEWELRHKKCPIQFLSELPELEDFRPFEPLEFLETPGVYDFHNDPVRSQKQYLFDGLRRDYGAHEATRILNAHRNFKRDYRELVFDTQRINERLQESYRDGLRLFFDNRSADQRCRCG